MSRSTSLTSPVHQQVLDQAPGPLQAGSVKGPIPFLNPTRATFELLPSPPDSASAPALTAAVVPCPPDKELGTTTKEPSSTVPVQVQWRARDNRKGRHILIVPPTHKKGDTPRVTGTGAAIARGVWRMVTVWAWWDVSWWIAILFTFGSALFVVSSLFYWLPLAAPQTEFPGESLVGGGVCSFIGATLFTVGGLLLIVEAANENQTGCFGWAVEHLFVAGEEGECRTAATGAEIRPRPEACRHRLHNRELRHGGIHLQHPSAGRRWEWAPTWREMRAHYLHEIGFLAAFIMAVGAVVFYVSGIMSLPGITNTLSLPTLLATYWLAYLLGGLLFTLSSLLYVLETQRKWYMPAPRVLGWWIGVFDLLGSVGWMLSAIFGYCTGVASWCVYQSDLTTLWASCCFLIASLGLWFEALDKYPVYRARE